MNRSKLDAPPHSLKAEQVVLAMCLEYPATIATLATKSTALFYDLRHAELFTTMKELHKRNVAIDVDSLTSHLREGKKTKLVGGLQYIAELLSKSTLPANLPYYLGILREKHSLRELLKVSATVQSRIAAHDGDVQTLLTAIQGELDTCTRIGMEEEKKVSLKMWKPSEILDYNPPADMKLVGDNEIVKGYEGLVLIAGPGSSGKSLAGSTLALAGAGAASHWMGREVHRRFKTMIIQAENGAIRLQAEFSAIKAQNPELPLDDYILVSSPPEGGLPFHKADFRAAIREEAARFKPDLVILDTWAQIAAEDAAKDVIDKLGEIRSCFPGGDAFPGIVIMAHTKKPRADEVRKGRGLINQVSGSIALANAARCVYMLLPWAEEMEDNRIYWACVKLNNGKMYPATVWHRQFGKLFVQDCQTNPKDFGRTDDEREKITDEHLREAFGDDAELRSSMLVKRLQKISGAGESTCWRAIGADGYLYEKLTRLAGGKVSIRKEA